MEREKEVFARVLFTDLGIALKRVEYCINDFFDEGVITFYRGASCQGKKSRPCLYVEVYEEFSTGELIKHVMNNIRVNNVVIFSSDGASDAIFCELPVEGKVVEIREKIENAGLVSRTFVVGEMPIKIIGIFNDESEVMYDRDLLKGSFDVDPAFYELKVSIVNI